MDELHAKPGICDLGILVRERRLRWFGRVTPASPAPHPSLGRGLLTLSTFLPLPPAGRGAQLLAALNRNRSAAASETRQPAPSIPSRQQGARTATTAGASAVPPSTSATLSALSTASSHGQQQHAAGASMESSSASVAVPGPSSTSTQEQPRASSSTAPKVQPHLTPAQGQPVRGEATGQSASSSSGAQGVSTSSSLTRASPTVDKITASAKQQPMTSSRGKRSQRGKRSARGRRAPPPPPPSEPHFPYDGDAHGMWQTLHWQKDLLLEKGTFSEDDLALNCQQRFIMRDLVARQHTAELTEERFREYVSQLPPLASSKEELRTLLFPEETTLMEIDTVAPATSTEHESSTPSERCVASPVEPQARPLREMSLGRLSPVSPSEAALLSSSDEWSSSSTVVAASPPTQGPLTPPPRSAESPDSPTLVECQLGSLGAPSLAVRSSAAWKRWAITLSTTTSLGTSAPTCTATSVRAYALRATHN